MLYTSLLALTSCLVLEQGEEDDWLVFAGQMMWFGDLEELSLLWKVRKADFDRWSSEHLCWRDFCRTKGRLGKVSRLFVCWFLPLSLLAVVAWGVGCWGR